jgi:hypothetical protein
MRARSSTVKPFASLAQSPPFPPSLQGYSGPMAIALLPYTTSGAGRARHARGFVGSYSFLPGSLLPARPVIPRRQRRRIGARRLHLSEMRSTL